MVQVDRIASLFLTQPLRTCGLVRSKPGVPILMYHSVSDDPEAGVSPYYRVATSPARFREQMRWLNEHGFETIDLPEALRRVRSNGPDAGRRSVVLTFDDGFQDFLTDAWPVLADYGFTATMFLPTAFVGRDASRQSFRRRPCLTWSEVRTLRACGATFGSHTVSHPILHRLPWTDIVRELSESRARLEEELQEPVNTFAYPYAFPQEDRPFVTRFRGELEAVGFTGAVTTVIGRATADADPLRLKRLPINECDDLPMFRGKLGGAYDWVGSVQLLSRTARTLTS